MDLSFPVTLTVYFHPNGIESLEIYSQPELDKWTGALTAKKYPYVLTSTNEDPTYRPDSSKLLTWQGINRPRNGYASWLSYLSRRVWPVNKKTMAYCKNVVKEKNEGKK